MEAGKRMKGWTIFTYLGGSLFLCVFVVSLMSAQSGKALAQAADISVDMSRGMLAVTANLAEGDLLSIEVMGPGSTFVVDEDVTSSSFTWAPGAGEPDGLYRYEIQVVDRATGNMMSRKAGTFTIRGGEIKAPREVTPVQQNNRRGMLQEGRMHLAKTVERVMTFLVPAAEAYDLTTESTGPYVQFDDTDDEDCSADWDWLIWANGGVNNADGMNWFAIYGRGEAATGNCHSMVPIVWINHDGGEGVNSPLNSLVIDDNGDLRFAANRMFFDRSESRLGIGLTTPGYTLDAVGDRIRLRNSTQLAARSIALRNDGLATDLEAQNADLWIRADLPAPAHNIYLLSNRVGVGTTAPLYKLTVSGEGSDRSTLHFTNTGTDVGGWLTSVADNNFFVSSGAMWNGSGWVQKSSDLKAVMAGSGPSGYRVMTRFGCGVGATCAVTTRMLIDYAGNVGFGIPTPGIPAPIHPLHMASGAHVTLGGVWTDASSRKYKDHIEELAIEDALKTIRNLNPVTFSYKADPSEKHVGFVAEDVPDLVATKDREGLSPMDIVAVMTKVVQEQQKVIEKQRSDMAKQQRIIDDLSARLERIERAMHH